MSVLYAYPCYTIWAKFCEHQTTTLMWAWWASNSKTMGVIIELALVSIYSSLHISTKVFLKDFGVSKRTCVCSAKRTFEINLTMLDEKTWPTFNIPIHHKGVQRSQRAMCTSSRVPTLFYRKVYHTEPIHLRRLCGCLLLVFMDIF